jgi:hypothetical protein
VRRNGACTTASCLPFASKKRSGDVKARSRSTNTAPNPFTRPGVSVPAWAARAAAGGPFSPHPDRPCVPTPQDFFSQVLVLGAMPDEREVVLLAVDPPVADGTRIG